MKAVDLKVLTKECGLQGYSKLRKAELITFLQSNLQSRTRHPPREHRPISAPHTRPPRPTRPPPPPPRKPINDDKLRPMPSVRFRPDRPRQPQLLRQLEERNSQPVMLPTSKPTTFKPYQLKPKRGKETFKEPPVEQPPSNQKWVERMKKKLDKLNKKIKGSELKGSNKPEESFTPSELEQAFYGAYKSYKINGRSRMDVDTFFDRIRQNLFALMNRILTDLRSARVQTTAWIRFKQALEDDFGNLIGYDRERLPFNSRKIEIFQSSDFKEIVDEMLGHMQAQIENPTLANSRFVFDEVLFLNISFYQLS